MSPAEFGKWLVEPAFPDEGLFVVGWHEGERHRAIVCEDMQTVRKVIDEHDGAWFVEAEMER